MKIKRSIFKKLLFLYFFLVLAVLLIAGNTESPELVTVQERHNHYILLIDASGSTVSNSVKVDKYKEVLMEHLPVYLYGNGFGTSIPRFNPEEDLLSIFYFGIVPQGYDRPYRYLANYDILRDFARARMIRQKGISQERLSEIIWPGEFFKLTILAWAKPLALARLLRRSNFSDVSNRVFLIMIHNGILNESTIREEITMVENWGNQVRLPEVKKAIDFISDNYMFSDCKGKSTWAWNKRFTANNEPIFLEAYQIVSKTQEEWKSNLEKFKNEDIAQLDFKWTKESGNKPEGYLQVKVDEQFFKFIDNLNDTASLTFTHKDYKKVQSLEFKPGLKLPVIFSAPLACQPMRCQTQLDIPITQQDNLLGTRTLYYHYRGSVETPLPFHCSFISVVNRVGIVLAILIFLFACLWFYYYRFYTFSIKVRFPGLSFPIHVKRNKDTAGGTPVHPKPGMPAFSIRLHNRFIQFVILRKAKISLDHREKDSKKEDSKNNLYWVNNGKKLEVIKLPVKKRKINIWWEKIPTKPTGLTINISKNKHNSKIRLNFPKGISTGGEK